MYFKWLFIFECYTHFQNYLDSYKAASLKKLQCEHSIIKHRSNVGILWSLLRKLPITSEILSLMHTLATTNHEMKLMKEQDYAVQAVQNAQLNCHRKYLIRMRSSYTIGACIKAQNY